MPAGPEPMTATRLPVGGLLVEGQRWLDAGRLGLQHLVAGVAVAVADGDGLLDLVAAAVLLAGRRADAAEHRGEGDGALEDARRLDEVTLGVGLEEARDVDVAGALVLAGRQAVGVVVAEDQLEVGLADLAQPRCLRPHDHAFLGLARAGDGRRLLALDLDHAHAAGAEAGQLGLVAERGHLDAVVAADLEDGLAGAAGQRAPIDLDAELGRDLAALRRLRREQALDGLVGSGLVAGLGQRVGHERTAPARRMDGRRPRGSHRGRCGPRTQGRSIASRSAVGSRHRLRGRTGPRRARRRQGRASSALSPGRT